jgi:L-alanine-DL-glutamate epimerase-like enolase superfamily enzyme
MATGENLFSHQDARNLLRHGGMRPDRDYLQFDCALSYGLVEYLRTLEVLEQNGWSSRRIVPHGGHQMSLNIAAGLHLGGNESYPDVFKPFGGFADGIGSRTAMSACRTFPGVGFEAKSELHALMRTLTDDLAHRRPDTSTETERPGEDSRAFRGELKDFPRSSACCRRSTSRS